MSVAKAGETGQNFLTEASKISGNKTINSQLQSTQQETKNEGVSTIGSPSKIKSKFITRPKYVHSQHQDILCMSKPEYQGKDFFQRSDFRGLLLADYQEAIGEKAFDCVEQLN